MNTVRTRFAPSPTGYMHVGNLRTALYGYLIAKHSGGKFILRVEDTDQARYVEGATDAIYRALADCGIVPDEGPNEGGDFGPYIQSERKELYKEYAEKLIELGGAYRDGDVIRQKISSDGETTFSDLVFGGITVPNSSPSMDEGVLLKSDGLPTYNLANVVDDHLMGITHVVRGSEYISSTPKYAMLYQKLGWEMPANITVPLIMRDQTHKLSKRAGDATYEDLISEGYLPEAIINYVALLGWNPSGEYAEQEFFTLDTLIKVFEISGISKSPAIFDKAKLKYFNACYIRRLPPKRFEALAEPWITKVLGSKVSADAKTKIAALLQPRIETLADIDTDKIGFFAEIRDYDTELFVNKKNKLDEAGALSILVKLYSMLTEFSDWDTLGEFLTNYAEANDIRVGKLYWTLRVALSGQAVTPGGPADIAAILGKEETLNRIDAAIGVLGE
ncbi:MAG: glutamate--tRNA ligase [Oscillospiraceae bacterium]|nr:glutamate--tRNA ligase [Oscillospiraceae bacterium]